MAYLTAADERHRNEQLIAQSNGRGGGIGALFAGLGAIIVALAAIALADDPEPTGWTYLFSTITAVGLAGVVLGFGFLWWPYLEGLPNDASVEVLVERLTTAPDTAAQQAFNMQRIHRRKEQVTRLILIGMGVVTIFGITTILSL